MSKKNPKSEIRNPKQNRNPKFETNLISEIRNWKSSELCPRRQEVLGISLNREPTASVHLGAPRWVAAKRMNGLGLLGKIVALGRLDG
jgi:hypothetical protein